MSEHMDFTPKDTGDYYPVLRWLIGKRLAILIVTLVIVVSILLVLLCQPWSAELKEHGYRTFDYDALLLRFYKGTVAIRGEDGHIAYIGRVSKGKANGKGTLYSSDGSVIYKGQFKNSLYSGRGTIYRANGTMDYSGDFKEGRMDGNGQLYNQSASLIYEGVFRADRILYEELAGKPTKEISEKYKGTRTVYMREQGICVAVPEIDALYYARNKEGTLENEWTVDGLYVMQSSFPAGNQMIRSPEEWKEYLGEPIYRGTTLATYSDTAAINNLPDSVGGFESRPYMELEQNLEGAYNVTGYDGNYEVYITTHEKEGFRYTFFEKEEGSGCAFYLIEPVSGEEGRG